MNARILVATCALATLVQAHPPAGTGYSVPGPHAHPNGTNVLVLYNTNWDDSNGNGKQDSLETAQYYAERRGVPTNNVFGIQVDRYRGRYSGFGPTGAGLRGTNVTIAYDVFYSNIVIPVVAKLNSTNSATGNTYREDVLFLCPVIGIPYYVDTFFAHPWEYPVYSLRSSSTPGFANHRLRSLDLLLSHVYRRLAGGIVWTNGTPRPGRAPACPYGYGVFWGDDQVEIGYPSNFLTEALVPLYYGEARDPRAARHFAELRAEDGTFKPESNGFFLVTRLDGPTVDSVKAMVDNALYAECYLANRAGQTGHPYCARVYAGDDANGTYFDSVFVDNRGVDIKNWFLGVNRGTVVRSVFDTNVTGTCAPWDVVYDNLGWEIGEAGSAARMRVKIDQVDAQSNTITVSYLGSQDYAWQCLPPHESGGVLSNVSSGVTVTVLAPRAQRGSYNVDSAAGCRVGDTLEHRSAGAFPFTDAFIFSDYYRDGAAYTYVDAFQWLPGSVGFYNQSWSAWDLRNVVDYQTFCSRACARGLTASGGALAEPLAIGIPFVPELVRPLAQGFTFAESCYSSLLCAESWMTVFIGDPLYSPFMGMWTNSMTSLNGDVTAPGLVVSVEVGRVHAWLRAATPDERVEVGQFLLYSGRDSNAWSHTNAFAEWPDSSSTTWHSGRRYGWRRSREWQLPDPTNMYYCQVVARDPFGNATTSAVRVVPVPEPLGAVTAMVLVGLRAGRGGDSGRRHRLTPTHRSRRR